MSYLILKKFLYVFYLLSFFWIYGCGSQNTGSTKTVTLTIEIAKKEAHSTSQAFSEISALEEAYSTPASAAGFACYAVNVMGAGIPSRDNNGGPQLLPALLSGSSFCSYPGVISQALYGAGSHSVSLIVPTGTNRVIQVLGITTQEECTKISTIGSGNEEGGGNSPSIPKIYELGRSTMDIMADATVRVPNAYDSDVNKLRRSVDCKDYTTSPDVIPLGLVGGYIGGITSTPISSTLPFTIFPSISPTIDWPNSGWSGTALTASQILSIQTNTPILFDGGSFINSAIRVDLIYEIPSTIDIQTYSGLSVTSNFVGIYNTGSTCTTDLPLSIQNEIKPPDDVSAFITPGAALYFAKGNTYGGSLSWSTFGLYNTYLSTTAGYHQHNFNSNSYGGIPADFAYTFSSGAPNASSKYIFLSYRTLGNSSSYPCLRINQSSVTLLK